MHQRAKSVTAQSVTTATSPLTPVKVARGFVMVVFLAILAVLVVVLSALLMSNKQSQMVASREGEEMKARNIAEACLSKGMAVAAEHFRQRGGESFDFDGLLDPNGISGDSDDHVFSNVSSGNVLVFVPAAAAGTSNEAAYRYSFELVDADGVGPSPPGGCFLRFDDNADDNLPGYAVQTSNTGGVIEGPSAGTNVSNRDRDASIVVTAIGVFPVLPTTVNADAYTKAHSRITMKQYFTATSAPAIAGNGDVVIAGSSELCGSGGVRAVDVTVATTSCVCGDGVAATINGSNIGSAVDECGVSRCPDSGALATNELTAIPAAPPFDTDFPESCLVYSETVGEPPAPFTVTDTIAANGQRNPRVFPRLPVALMLYLRADGDVFAWDNRPLGDVFAATAAATRCDGFPGGAAWPPPTSTSPANDAAKTAFCQVAEGATFQCPNTVGNFDLEVCFQPQILDAGGVETQPFATSTTRCDGLGEDTDTPADGVQVDELLTQSALQGNQAAKDALCAVVTAGARCNVSSDLLDTEVCSTPNSPRLNCSGIFDPFNHPPEATWTTMDFNASAFEAPKCFPQPTFSAVEPRFHTGAGAPCTTAARDAYDSAKLCWRMVASLKVGGATADLKGIAEWESGASAKLELPAGQMVPNVRVDGRLLPSGDAANPVTVPAGGHQVVLSDLMGTARALPVGGPPLPLVAGLSVGPTLHYDSDSWDTEANWTNNGVTKLLPRPSVVFVEAGADPLVFGSNTHVGDVNWLVLGDVDIPSGAVALASSAVATTAVDYAGGADGCTVEVPGAPTSAWVPVPPSNNFGPARGGAGPVIIASGSIEADASSLSLFGKVIAGGRMRIGTPAGAACLVGGVSVGSVGPSLGCSAGVCDDVGLCLEHRNSIIGSVFVDDVGGVHRDLLAPEGLFAQRGTTPDTRSEQKISQLMSKGNICINGASRISGQIVSDLVGGRIEVGPDLLMLQTGEIGIGFATKKTTWTDNSW